MYTIEHSLKKIESMGRKMKASEIEYQILVVGWLCIVLLLVVL